MPKKIVKLKELQQPDVSFISLVNRPANRTPIRIMKADGEGELSGILKKVGCAPSKPAPSVVALIIRKENKEQLIPELEKLGFCAKYQVETEDAVILSMRESFDESLTCTIEVSEDVAVLVDEFDSTKKAFNSESGILPGVITSTNNLVEQLNDATDKEGLASVLKAYSNHTLGLVENLPEMVFNLEKINMINLQIKKADADPKDGEVIEKAEVEATEVVETEAEKEMHNCPEGMMYDKDQGKCVEKADDEEAAKEDEVVEETPVVEAEAETEVVKEDSTEVEVEAVEEVAEPVVEEAAKEEEVKEEEVSQQPDRIDELVDLVRALKGDLDAMKEELAQEKAKAAKAESEAEAAKEAAQKAEDKVAKTVVSCAIPNESLGTFSRINGPQVLKNEQSKKSEDPDAVWAGVLDGLF